MLFSSPKLKNKCYRKNTKTAIETKTQKQDVLKVKTEKTDLKTLISYLVPS